MGSGLFASEDSRGAEWRALKNLEGRLGAARAVDKDVRVLERT
jgi:hypothetical protein